MRGVYGSMSGTQNKLERMCIWFGHTIVSIKPAHGAILEPGRSSVERDRSYPCQRELNR